LTSDILLLLELISLAFEDVDECLSLLIVYLIITNI
jgi:hypothetical protein